MKRVEKIHRHTVLHFANEINDIIREPEDRIRDQKLANCVFTEAAILNDKDFLNDYEEVNYKVTLANLHLHGKNKLDYYEVLHMINRRN